MKSSWLDKHFHVHNKLVWEFIRYQKNFKRNIFLITHQTLSSSPHTKNADSAFGVLRDFELFYCRRMSLNLAVTKESFNALPPWRETPPYLTAAFEQSLSTDLIFTTTGQPHFPEKSCYHLSPPLHLSKRFSYFKDSQPSCNRVQLYILDSYAAETDNWRALQEKLQCTERKCKIRKLKFHSIITSSSNAQKKKYQRGKVWHPEGKKSDGSSGHWH